MRPCKHRRTQHPRKRRRTEHTDQEEQGDRTQRVEAWRAAEQTLQAPRRQTRCDEFDGGEHQRQADGFAVNERYADGSHADRDQISRPPPDRNQ